MEDPAVIGSEGWRRQVVPMACVVAIWLAGLAVIVLLLGLDR